MPVHANDPAPATMAFQPSTPPQTATVSSKPDAPDPAAATAPRNLQPPGHVQGADNVNTQMSITGFFQRARSAPARVPTHGSLATPDPPPGPAPTPSTLPGSAATAGRTTNPDGHQVLKKPAATPGAPSQLLCCSQEDLHEIYGKGYDRGNADAEKARRQLRQRDHEITRLRRQNTALKVHSQLEGKRAISRAFEVEHGLTCEPAHTMSDRHIRRLTQAADAALTAACPNPTVALDVSVRLAKRRMGEHDNADAKAEAGLLHEIAAGIKGYAADLRKRAGPGRWSNNDRAANVGMYLPLAHAANNASDRKVADLLNLNRKQLSAARERLKQVSEDENGQLIPFRGAQRSDSLPEEWVEFAVQYWTANTRVSEQRKDTITDKHNRKDKTPHRIHFLESSVGMLYVRFNRDGAIQFKTQIEMNLMPQWHFSTASFRACRPFFVKSAKQDCCVCTYHLHFDFITNGIRKLRLGLREMMPAGDRCDCRIHCNGHELRQALICARPEGEPFYGVRCLQRACPSCPKISELFCEKEKEELHKWKELGKTIKCEVMQSEMYKTKDGDMKKKKDFKKVPLTASELIKELRDQVDVTASNRAKNKLHARIHRHHDLAQWQSRTWKELWVEPPRGWVLSIQDFSENYSHFTQHEQQSKYFLNVSTCVYTCMLRFRVEDRVDLGDDVKEQLLASGISSITESHFGISPDLRHDTAFVISFMQNHIVPYLERVCPGYTRFCLRTDGCKGQYKNATMMLYVSAFSTRTGRKMDMSFFCSCHGKSEGDGEGGVIKNACMRHELRNEDTLDIGTTKLNTSEEMFGFLATNESLIYPGGKDGVSGKDRPIEQRGKGIWIREFFWMPIKGPNSVNRRITKCQGIEGMSKMHSFQDIGHYGIVRCRFRSCWDAECPNCKNQVRPTPADCNHEDRCGKATSVTLRRLGGRAGEIMDMPIAKNVLCQEGAEMAKELELQDDVAVEIENDHQDAYMIVRVVRTTQPARHDVPLEKNWMGTVKKGDAMFIGQAFVPQAAGSNILILTNCRYHIPAEDVRVIKLDLGERQRPAVARTRSGAAPTAAAVQEHNAKLGDSLTKPTKERPHPDMDLGPRAARYRISSSEIDRILLRLPG